MDFKIEDTYEENGASKKKSNNTFSVIIIVVIALIFGLSVFFISNALFGKKVVTPPPPTNTDVSLSDENVSILHDYVTYGENNSKSDKFVKEQSVNLETFSDQEKFYYALQFCQIEDFTLSNEVDANNQPIYKIPLTTIKKYMQLFFGNKVKFSTEGVITHTFDFKINNNNVGTMTYSVADDSYNTVFTEFRQPEAEKVVEPFYSKLVKATRIGKDNSLELQEKVIYTVVQEVDGVYTIGIYKDYQHTILLETKQNLTADQLKANPIKIDDYLGNAATVKYTFKLNRISYYNGEVYYFDNSVITK